MKITNEKSAKKMEIVNHKIEQYLRELFPINDPVLKKMEERYKNLNFPSVGPLVGQLLHQLVIMTRARHIFEMGSGFGYSALWMAKALPPDGKITCTDMNKENKLLAEQYFKEAGEFHKLDFRVGNAINILSQEKQQFDVIFCDIDKESYPKAFQLAMNKLRVGGILVTDNVLWRGQVADPQRNDSATTGVKEYNRLISTSPNVISTIIPIRDGVAISLKTSE